MVDLPGFRLDAPRQARLTPRVALPLGLAELAPGVGRSILPVGPSRQSFPVVLALMCRIWDADAAVRSPSNFSSDQAWRQQIANGGLTIGR